MTNGLQNNSESQTTGNEENGTIWIIFHDEVNLLFSQKNPRLQSKCVFILLPWKNLNSGEGRKEGGRKKKVRKKMRNILFCIWKLNSKHPSSFILNFARLLSPLYELDSGVWPGEWPRMAGSKLLCFSASASIGKLVINPWLLFLQFWGISHVPGLGVCDYPEGWKTGFLCTYYFFSCSVQFSSVT